jgi:16S rRNA (guanine(966)-N(2))-methyltransferase RsmD
MRIIAGALRGRALAAPKDARTRPMLEKTRGAVFNILGERVAGRRVLDLFAGTGSLGIEALSRGAERATFVERDPGARRSLERNVAAFGLEGRAEVVAAEAARFVERIEPGEFDLVFVDPPYRFVTDERERSRLLAWFRELWARGLAVKGIIVFHFPEDSLDAARFAPAVPWTVRHYGRNSVAMFEKLEP